MKSKKQQDKQQINKTTASSVQLKRPLTPVPNKSVGMQTAVHHKSLASQTDRSQRTRILQRKVGNARTGSIMHNQGIQRKPNNTGLPDNLKSGVESLSGMSMDDVQVHYNSDKPAQLQALAYTQGTAIHVSPGQEKHLPHEAWHVVQQMQGRVQSTMQAKGVSMNDDPALEREADLMGEKAATQKSSARFTLEGHDENCMNWIKANRKPGTRSRRRS